MNSARAASTAFTGSICSYTAAHLGPSLVFDQVLDLELFPRMGPVPPATRVSSEATM
jgi:hypothetical protein